MRSLLASVAVIAAIPGIASGQESGPAYLKVRSVPHGTVKAIAYRSKSLGTDRSVVVYTPPGYEKSSNRYPVLYLLHGSTFRVYGDRDHRAIAGLSLGGAQSLAIGLSHTDLFSRVAGFSSAMGAGGAHTYAVWQRYLNEVAPMLFQE